MQPIPEDWTRAVAVVAHPDDLEYGVASAVARWTGQGKKVVYVLATRGEAGIAGMDPGRTGLLRVEEERRSAAVVGVSEVEFLSHEDGLVEYGLPSAGNDAARIVDTVENRVAIRAGFSRPLVTPDAVEALHQISLAAVWPDEARCLLEVLRIKRGTGKRRRTCREKHHDQ